MTTKTRKNGLLKLTGFVAAFFALLLVISPAFAASHPLANPMALSIILPALALCCAIIFGLWRHTARISPRAIRVRSTYRY